MGLTIYGIGASRASRPLWMLEELGIDYTHKDLTYKNRATRTPEFLALNPNGHIPVLDDDGIIVWESMAITLYLARRFAGSLSPETDDEYANVLKWTFWVVTECEKDALTVLFQTVAGPLDQRDDSKLSQAESRLAVPLEVLNAHLAGREYVAADRFTVADINLAAVLAWVQPSRSLMNDHPRVSSWLTNCLARPAQKRVRELARASR